MIFFKNFFTTLVILLIIFLSTLIIFLIRSKKKLRYYHGLITRLKIPKSYMPVWFYINMILLLVSMARPYLIKSYTSGQDYGVAMILALDVSGSMAYIENKESRFDTAKKAAINFIKKRVHDHIGLVLFGKVALTRCPLTYDKQFLINTIKEYNLGEINPQGTVLFQSLLTAINRLKDAKTNSKVIILLTDGLPDNDGVLVEDIISLAKKFKIKIYTIGVGLTETNLPYVYQDICKKAKKLLHHISDSTDAKSFNAEQDMQLEEIYNLIDLLETSKNNYDIPIKIIDIDWIFAFIFILSEFLRRFKYCYGACF